MRRRLLVLTMAVAASAGIGSAASAEDTTYVAHLSGDSEVPANDSKAAGNAVFRLSADGTELSYRLIVANIENVVAGHIHIAPAGQNGAVTAFLYGPAAPGTGRTQGVIATGVITAEDLIGPLAGETLETLIDLMETDLTYVNVHTNDGLAPGGTGPGDLPGGEIRGQIR